MRINVHAGHNPANKVACGAIGLLDELNNSIEKFNTMSDIATGWKDIAGSIPLNAIYAAAGKLKEVGDVLGTLTENFEANNMLILKNQLAS